MERTKPFPFLVFAGILFLTSLDFASCKKVPTCFDEDFYEEHKNDICLQDCPGVTGCDGKFYCNECIANSNGIRVE